jgi:capsular polysaccharide biosynthesis protein
VRNEDEVRTLLQRYDFETIYFEDYSLKEQITIASEAEIMIAPHGSGATHSLFMDEGSLLIELFPHKRRKSSDCFESLSVIGKNRYYPRESELPDDGDIDVNCSALHTLLERESRVMNVRGEVLAGNVAERIGAHELSL